MQSLLVVMGTTAIIQNPLLASKEVEDFALRYAEHHLNDKGMLIKTDNIVLMATNVQSVSKDFTFVIPDGRNPEQVNKIVIPADNFNKEVLQGTRQSLEYSYVLWSFIINHWLHSYVLSLLDPYVVCVVVAVLLQFFYTSALCWMFVEGIQLYLQIVKVFNSNVKMRQVYGFAWGKYSFPTLLIICSLSIAGNDPKGLSSFVSHDL
ncbi:hypothetical protein QZH41_008279 [Actinostola sp. cb2023]|nr:hypothetical protein QZH41_008279 [Actinostola sp. cb2023]